MFGLAIFGDNDVLTSLGRSHLEDRGHQKLCGLFTKCSGVSWEDGECTNYEGIAR